MRVKKFGNTEIAGMDWAAAERQAALRSMHCLRVRHAPTVSSGWDTDVAGGDKRSVHASLNGKGNLRAAWWNLFSRAYVVVIPDADLERAMYSFHRMHHMLTLGWLSYVLSVSETTVELKQRGLLAALHTAAADRSCQPR
jgi:hypothetical protein